LPRLKSAIKRVRSTKAKTERNKSVISTARTYVSKANKLIALASEDAPAAVQKAISVLDRAAEKGIIHPNNAARRKSRLMRKFNQAFPSK